MEDKKIPVNDGGGLYDSVGLIDTLIVDMNNLVRRLAAGEYVGFCTMIVSIVQRLAQLKAGVQHDTNSLKEQIEEYKKMIEGDGA